jgi:hypothetical protein
MLEKARYLLVNEIAQASGTNELLVDERLLLALSEAGLKFPDIAGEA